MRVLRTRLLGLVALLGVAGIVIGLPAVLLALGATPTQMSLPAVADVWSFLTGPDDGTIFLVLVQVVAWVAWALLTVSILLELLSRVRGIRPPRLPGLKLPQSAARGLVSTMLLLFLAAPVAAQAAPADAPGAGVPAPAAVSTITTSPVDDLTTPTPPQTASAPTERTAASATPASTTAGPTHTVRQGESLWSIAQQHLGSGQRYNELVELNSDLLGGRADFLEPGWQLRLPAAETPEAPPATVVVEEGDTLSSIAQQYLGDAERWPEIAAASSSIEQPGGYQLSDPDAIDTGWTLRLPTASEPTPAAEQQPVPPVAEQEPVPPVAEQEPVPPAAEQEPVPPVAEQEPVPPAAEQQPVPPAAEQQPAPPAAEQQPGSSTTQTETDQETSESDGTDVAEEAEESGVRTAFGVGALMAAGVVGLIAGRRRLQQRRRPLGQPMPMPTGSAAVVEQDLRATADVLSVEAVDAALRALARDCAAAGTPLPTLRAARLTATTFDLYLHEPTGLPTPWMGTDDATVWSLDVADAGAVDAAALSQVPSPYPALVTIGHDEEDGHVLLDLEQLTALAVTGEPEATSAVLAAMAIDLATSHWADDLQVTVVGFYAELEDALQTGRIRYLPSAERVLEELVERSRRDQETLAAAGSPSLQHARVTGTAPHTWAPELVLVGAHLSEDQLEQLTELVQATPRMAIAAVTTGPPVGEWQLDLTDDQPTVAGVLEPLGLRLRPQMLPRAEYDQLLEVAMTSDLEELPEPVATSSEPTLAELAAAREAATATDLPVTGDTATGDQEQDASRPAAENDHDATDVAATSADEPGTGSATTSAAAAAAAGLDETLDEVTADDAGVPEPEGPVLPRILVLGPPDVADPQGKVEPTRRGRLVELATYLALHPTASAAAIDDAVWPHRTQQDNRSTRNSATTKLRRWLGRDADGAELLVYDQATQGYATSAALSCDVDEWRELLAGAPQEASTEDLQAALGLVRGRPFEGHHPKKYAWAEPFVQRLTGEIVDASHELGRRRLMEGRWRAAEEAVIVGLAMEPAHEPLWRLRILAAHESRNPEAEAEAVERLLTITEQLDCDLEPETETLLAALKQPRGAEFDQLVANAL